MSNGNGFAVSSSSTFNNSLTKPAMFTNISKLVHLCATMSYSNFFVRNKLKINRGAISNTLSRIEKNARNIAMRFNTKKIYCMGSRIEEVQ